MNSVTPTGLTNAASRSDASKFFSQSENDIAAAFAELLKYEGISPASDPSPAPSSSNARRSANDSSTSPESDSHQSPSTATTAPSSASNEQDDDDSERDDEVVVANAVQPVPTQQQNQTDAASGDNASSTEEAELEAILADAQSLQQEIESSGAEQPQHAGAQTPTGESAAGFAEELAAAAGAVAGQAVVDPAADASPRVNVPVETEVINPLRRAGALDEEGDAEEGFAIEDLSDEGGVDADALAELVAKAVATAESAQNGKSGERDEKPKADRREKADAAAGVDAAAQAAGADRAADASAAVVASIATSDATSATTKTDGSAVDALGASASAGSASRHETTGSLQRSIERPSDSERRQLAGADRSRFFDRVERAFKSAEQGDGSIRMRLHPAELGAMQLTLERGEGGEWIARIETETQEAKRTLLEHVGALKERLAEQDFRLGRIEVETPSDRRQQNAPDFQENPQSFSRGRDRRDDERTGEDRAAEAAPASAAPGDRSRRLDVTI